MTKKHFELFELIASVIRNHDFNLWSEADDMVERAELASHFACIFAGEFDRFNIKKFQEACVK